MFRGFYRRQQHANDEISGMACCRQYTSSLRRFIYRTGVCVSWSDLHPFHRLHPDLLENLQHSSVSLETKKISSRLGEIFSFSRLETNDMLFFNNERYKKNIFVITNSK